jgi:serine/threonine-protein kinase
LAGKYRVERILANGGMGVVLAAHHLQLDHPVALKFMLPKSVEDAEAQARFQREARAAARLRSQHVARVLDIGALEDGLPFIVMEYLEGQTLAKAVRSDGPLPVTRAVKYMLQACEALAEAHALGIVHRDLKPSNLFETRGPDGSPLIKVLDFGVSKVPTTTPPGEGEGAGTGQHHILGSAIYMSPEQILNPQNVDARADIWSLGVILFELVTGKAPFLARSAPETCVKILYVPSPSLAPLAPTAPRSFVAAVDRCLAKKREERFANVAELAAALLPHGDPKTEAAFRIANILGPTRAAPLPDDDDPTTVRDRGPSRMGGNRR